MAKALTQITVFISGTSETDAEKAALRAVLADLSRVLEKSHSVTLRVIGWPDDFRPGVNANPQAEINRQIGSTYDVYVGLLGARFGTPTARAESGTQEEFEAAVGRFRQDPRKVRVLFYFKRAIDDPFTMDISQLEKVKEFRARLTTEGVLSRDFKDTTAFVEMVKDHIFGLIADEWKDDQWTEVAGIASGASPASSDGPNASLVPALTAAQTSLISGDLDDTTADDLGLLDYMSAFHDAVLPMGEALGRIAEHQQRFTGSLKKHTADMNRLQEQHVREPHVGGSRAQQQFIARARDVVNAAAVTLDQFATDMAPDFELYRVNGRALFSNLELSTDEGLGVSGTGEANEENVATLKKLIAQMDSARTATGGFESTVRQLPGLTGKFKRARQRVAALLGEFIAELSFEIEKADAILRRMTGGGPKDDQA